MNRLRPSSVFSQINGFSYLSERKVNGLQSLREHGVSECLRITRVSLNAFLCIQGLVGAAIIIQFNSIQFNSLFIYVLNSTAGGQ
jgi:hypothetical protein